MEFSDQTDLLKLNAALTTLTKQWDEDAAHMVISALHSLPLSNHVTTIKHIFKNDSSLTGYTKEAGNVTFPNRETKTTIAGEREENIARVGQYKVKRHCFNKRPDIRWQHFWKSDPTTMLPGEIPNPIFALQYSETTLQPVALWRFDFYEDITQCLPVSILLHIWLKNAATYVCNLFSQRYYYTYENECHMYNCKPTLLFLKHKM